MLGSRCLTPTARPASVQLGTRPARRQACVIVNAAKTKSGKIGFKWDAANARWRRDDAYADAVEKTGVTIKPFSGPEYVVWPVIHTSLTEVGLKSISTDEAAALAGKGWTLVDIRLGEQFDRQHAEGAVSVPLFRYVRGNSLLDNVKRLAMAGFAMAATERNTDFEQEALSKLKKNQKIIVMCDIGGTLETVVKFRKKQCKDDPDRAFGRESRSLKACFEFMQIGWNVNNIRHLKGGLPQWRYDGYPVDSS